MILDRISVEIQYKITSFCRLFLLFFMKIIFYHVNFCHNMAHSSFFSKPSSLRLFGTVNRTQKWMEFFENPASRLIWAITVPFQFYPHSISDSTILGKHNFWLRNKNLQYCGILGSHIQIPFHVIDKLNFYGYPHNFCLSIVVTMFSCSVLVIFV